MGGHIKHPDASLLPFLQAADEAQAEDRLAALIAEQTESTIKGIVRRKLRVSLSSSDSSHRSQDALEIVGDIQTAVVGQLRDLKSNERAAISNFHGYVASVTFNACHQYLRRKYPQRWRLKNKLRYLLTHHQVFDLWENSDGEWLCNLAPKLNSQETPATRTHVQKLLENRRVVDETLRNAKGVSERKLLVDLLTTTFEQLQSPVVLDDLVGLIADLQGIKENVASLPADEQRINGLHEQLTAPQASVVTELEQHVHLEKLWAEIRQLPLRHRAALLLNLKDRQGDSVIALLPVTRIATIRQIAEVLAFTPEHFAHVWNELPWDDLTIAKHLQLTRQQIINLRQSARARLRRRLKRF